MNKKETLMEKRPEEKRVVDDGDVIDLYRLACYLMGHAFVIILCMIIGAALLGYRVIYTVAPTYQSTAKMYMVSSSKDSVINMTDLNLASSLSGDYQELIYSYPVLDRVINELGLDMEDSTLASMISLENPSNTRVLRITVTSTDPVQARDIANAVVDVCLEYLPETMGSHKPNVVQEARIAQHKSGPDVKKQIMVGALLGALLSIGFYTFRFLMDDTIHNSEDMEREFGITPLSVIPESEKLVKWKGKR